MTLFGSTQPIPAFGSSANPLRGFGDVAGSTIGNIISHFEPGPSAPPDPHSYLYSDPTRNAEEIQALLKNIRPDEDLPAELRKGTPPEMATTLLEHQKLGLTWLTRQEDGSNKGGILADDMGLGKTIQAIALMVSRPAEDERKTNLIIGPVALLGQWQSEIEEKVKSHYKLSIFRYHGTKCSWNKLKKYDVVLTTYGTLGSEWKKLNEWEKEKMMNPDEHHPPLDLPLTGKDSKWYRYEHPPRSTSLTFQGDS
jgi:SNF2 family DNA or RNA helicase